MLLPFAEIPDVSRAPNVGGLGLGRIHHGVVDADREEHHTFLAVLALLKPCFVVSL